MQTITLHDENLCILVIDVVDSTPVVVNARATGESSSVHAAIEGIKDLWRIACVDCGACFVKDTGDGLIVTFHDPLAALRAVEASRRATALTTDASLLPVRAGLHIGTVSVKPDGDIIGADANLANRVAGVASAGDVVASDAFMAQVRPYLREYAPVDLGTRLLKGFEANPIHLWSLFGLAVISTSADLPVTPDAFVGRDSEREDLRTWLRDPIYRGITIVGTAGCGKTRLALQSVADSSGSFPGGALFVPLEEAVDAGGVVSRIAAALGITASPQADLFSLIRGTLAGRHALLVLDNFEQALPAATVISELLASQSLSELHVLVTSREPLRFRGERVFDLDPLPVPSASAGMAEIGESESVKLFVRRVQAVRRRFALTEENAAEIAEVCRIVSGLPLALEIVAAEARHRPVSELRNMGAELLGVEADIIDIPDRHRSLTAAFDWSYRQLSQPDQLLFNQLGLFETAFSENLVYEVCTGADIDRGLRRLCGKRLVCIEEQRQNRPYRLLVPVRQYARERMGLPEGAVRERFVAAFTHAAQRLYDLWYEGEESRAIEGMLSDLENFRSAWRIACEDDDAAVIAGFGVNVTFFAPMLPKAANIESWVEDTERAARGLNDLVRLGSVYNTRARLSARAGRYVEAVGYQRESLRLREVSGSDALIADGHSTLAMFALRAQDEETAGAHARKGIELARTSGSAEPEATALFVLARVLARQDPEEAARLAERSLSLYHELRSPRGAAHACVTLAFIAEARGDMASAERQYHAALRLCSGQGEPIQVVRCLENMSRFYKQTGEHYRAETLIDAARSVEHAEGLPESHGQSRRSESGSMAIPPAAAMVVEQVLSASPLFT
jgi:predicted ATPase/class 3 adenylate cyclase